MDLNNIENLEDVELFDLQNQITEIIKKRNLEKGDIEEIIDNSFTSAIFKSRWVFSITFDASAILIDSAKCVPALIISLYRLSTSIAAAFDEPDVTFIIEVTCLSLSPGFIRSGE